VIEGGENRLLNAAAFAIHSASACLSSSNALRMLTRYC
jgi:hypothetical protein